MRSKVHIDDDAQKNITGSTWCGTHRLHPGVPTCSEVGLHSNQRSISNRTRSGQQ